MKAKPDKVFLENLTEEQKGLSSRIFDLAIGRVLERVHARLDEKGQQEMEQVFLSDNDEEKGRFVKKNIPDFKAIFEEEATQVGKEIITEMANQAGV